MDARLAWFVLGGALGFILGYIVRSLREIHAKVEEVDQHVISNKNDSGFMSNRIIADTLMLIVVAFTVWASITSQVATNKVTKQQNTQTQQQTQLDRQQKQLDLQQKRQDAIVQCIQTYFSATLTTLNSRATYSLAQIKANVDLQAAFNKVVQASLQQPPLDDAQARKIVTEYATALNHFLDISKKNGGVVTNNPFPSALDFLNCVNTK